jgi:hypothetical protein
MNDAPLYTSKRSAKNLWQEYRIYRDRLELQSWALFHTIIVPANQIQAIEVRPSAFASWKGTTWGIKIDNCDLCRHVLLKRKPRFSISIGFSPDEPEKFVEICQTILPDEASSTNA